MEDMRLRLLGCFAALGLVTACTQTAAPPSTTPAAVASGVTPTAFRLPEGTGCAGEIGRYRAVIANDRDTGHLGRAVHDRIVVETDRAAAACAAGRDAEALGLLRSTKSRYGYV